MRPFEFIRKKKPANVNKTELTIKDIQKGLEKKYEEEFRKQKMLQDIDEAKRMAKLKASEKVFGRPPGKRGAKVEKAKGILGMAGKKLLKTGKQAQEAIIKRRKYIEQQKALGKKKKPLQFPKFA